MTQFYTLQENLETLPVRDDVDVDQMLRDLAYAGMKKHGFHNKQEYIDRIEEELDLIIRKKFSVYFIILWDAIRWCRRNGVRVGPGRGSAGASLLCMCLDITKVDPIKYKLLFFRFLSEWRQDWPDVDVDIADSKRILLKKYLENKYGSDKVASITTFTYFTPKSAIKDACRVLKVPFAEANEVTKNFPDDASMDEFKHAKYRSFHEKYPGVYKLAKGLEGRLQKVGYHAAGTVITRMPISDIVSLESRKLGDGDDERQAVVSVPKEVAEELGLIKYDFLGLKTLTVIDDCVEMLRKRGVVLDIDNIDFDDSDVIKMIAEGHTVGVFQMEASASTKVVKDMNAETFSDIYAATALVRPGAMNVIGDDFIAIKRGHKKPTYPTPESKDFLEETLGLNLFQENTLQICTEIAELSNEDADTIRRLTAKKKDPALLQKFQEKFINGASPKIGVQKAERLWKDIETTAAYQFNKCLAEDTLVFVKAENYRQQPKFMMCEVGDLHRKFQEYEDWDFFILGPEVIKSGSAGGQKWYKIKNTYDSGVQDIYRVWINENWYIDATATHKHRLSKGWREARRIHQMDRIATADGMQTVWKKTWEGKAHTYDIELYDEPHAFYANGIITHNCHAVEYSMITMQTAYLKYYYPAEFMAALLMNEKEKGAISDYLGECKRLGIAVKTPDVNKSGTRYEVRDGNIYMGLSSVKYISDKLAERLIAQRPFKSYEDLKEKIMTKGSGLNSRVLDALNKIGAANFPDHPVDMEECKKNFYEYLGIASFDNAQITPTMRRRITPLDEYQKNGTAIVYGMVKDIVQKNGWIRVDMQDESGSQGFFVSPDHPFEKGKLYVVALAGGRQVGCVNMEEFSGKHPIAKYLKGDFKEKTWMVAAKAEQTKTGKDRATILYVFNGKLDYCTAWSDVLPNARRIRPGTKIRMKMETSPKWGNTLKAIIKDERDE